MVQFGLGVSISPVLIERMTNTNKAGVQEGKDRGMAPLGYRIVQHGVYAMPYFVNPTAAKKSGCTDTDIELMKKLIPYAYTHTASYIRPDVRIRHAWHMEHFCPLGSCSDFKLLEAMMPRRTRDEDTDIPSKCWADYFAPTSLPSELADRVTMTDLMDQILEKRSASA